MKPFGFWLEARIAAQDMRRVLDAYDARIAELEKQLDDLKRSKGCAKLEVTEPPKNFMPRKEHDS